MSDKNWTEVRGSKMNRKHVNIDLITLHQKIKYIIDKEIETTIDKSVLITNKYTNWIVK